MFLFNVILNCSLLKFLREAGKKKVFLEPFFDFRHSKISTAITLKEGKGLGLNGLLSASLIKSYAYTKYKIKPFLSDKHKKRNLNKI